MVRRRVSIELIVVFCWEDRKLVAYLNQYMGMGPNLWIPCSAAMRSYSRSQFEEVQKTICTPLRSLYYQLESSKGAGTHLKVTIE